MKSVLTMLRTMKSHEGKIRKTALAILTAVVAITLSACNVKAPSDLKVKTISCTQLDVAWSDNSDNDLGFKLERSTDGHTFTEIAKVGANVIAYSDKDLAPNTLYYYRVRAHDFNSDSAYSNIGSARTLIVTWKKTFAGEPEKRAWSIWQTADDGYLVAGDYAYSTQTLMKLDMFGTVVWEKPLLSVTGVHALSDGEFPADGYVFVGNSSYQYGGRLNFFKLDLNGNVVWSKNYDPYAISVKPTSDGGYLIGGAIAGTIQDSSYIVVLKTDGTGNLEWRKTLGLWEGSRIFSIRETDGGGYIVDGTTKDPVTQYSVIMAKKFDGNGNTVWQKTYGGQDNTTVLSYGHTKDGGYVFSGNLENYGTGWMLRLDENLNKVWEKRYFGVTGYAIRQTPDGGYAVAGGYAGDMSIMKLDADGNQLWLKYYGEALRDTAFSMDLTKDGGYVAAGALTTTDPSSFEMFIAKFDPSGDIHE